MKKTVYYLQCSSSCSKADLMIDAGNIDTTAIPGRIANEKVVY